LANAIKNQFFLLEIASIATTNFVEATVCLKLTYVPEWKLADRPISTKTSKNSKEKNVLQAKCKFM
jgi:hypothetical protein